MSKVTIDSQHSKFWKFITFFFGFGYFVLSLYYGHFYDAIICGGIIGLLAFCLYWQYLEIKKAVPNISFSESLTPKAKPEQTQKWIPFFFDGDLYFNMVETPEDWAQCLEIYAVNNHTTVDRFVKENLLEAKRCPRIKEYPRFGFYMEYTGPETLGEWAAKEGMPL